MPVMRGHAWRGPDGTPLAATGEFGVIDRLAEIIRSGSPPALAAAPRFPIGIGDDAAAFRPTPGFDILLTNDIQILGRHFSADWLSPEEAGARCASVNLSDIAAMGGAPVAGLASLAVGPEIAVEDLEGIYRGLVRRMADHGAVVAGGNLSAADAGLFIDLTVVGEVERGRAVRRAGAQAGDLLCVTGHPGSAAAGLEALRRRADLGGALDPWQELIDAYKFPVPRILEGQAIARSGTARAMIDISDGLVGDLRQMLRGTGLGAVLREEALAVSESQTALAARIGRPPLSFLLGPSDDYELLVAVPAERLDEARRCLPGTSPVTLRPIGTFIEDEENRVVLEDRSGVRRPVEGGGWDHFRPVPAPPH